MVFAIQPTIRGGQHCQCAERMTLPHQDVMVAVFVVVIEGLLGPITTNFLNHIEQRIGCPKTMQHIHVSIPNYAGELQIPSLI